jgi:hypothetical protein
MMEKMVRVAWANASWTSWTSAGDRALAAVAAERAEHGEPEARAEVAPRLRDARDLAGVRARRAVDGVGARRAEDQPEPGPRDRDGEPLVGERRV